MMSYVKASCERKTSVSMSTWISGSTSCAIAVSLECLLVTPKRSIFVRQVVLLCFYWDECRLRQEERNVDKITKYVERFTPLICLSHVIRKLRPFNFLMSKLQNICDNSIKSFGSMETGFSIKSRWTLSDPTHRSFNFDVKTFARESSETNFIKKTLSCLQAFSLCWNENFHVNPSIKLLATSSSSTKISRHIAKSSEDLFCNLLATNAHRERNANRSSTLSVFPSAPVEIQFSYVLWLWICLRNMATSKASQNSAITSSSWLREQRNLWFIWICFSR